MEWTFVGINKGHERNLHGNPCPSLYIHKLAALFVKNGYQAFDAYGVPRTLSESPIWNTDIVWQHTDAINIFPNNYSKTVI